MYNRLIKYLDKYSIIFLGSLVLMPINHSTEHALMLITDKIKRAIEGDQFSCGIFLNLTKAFETINHNSLLAKLYSYEIRGIAYDWCASYLTNQVQFDSIGNTTSTSISITCGVPQGSVFGPLSIPVAHK